MFQRNKSEIEAFRIQTELRKEFLKKAKSKKMNLSEAVREAIVHWLAEK